MVFTCVNCNVVYGTAELQRDHYKSEWHRYNLKRKLAELPPLTEEKFGEKLAQNSSAESAADKNLYCRPCRKAFNNTNSYDDHMVSKKHFQNVEKNNGDDDTEEYLAKQDPAERKAKTAVQETPIDYDNDDDFEDMDTDEEIDFDVDTNSCIFCKVVSADLVANIKHMSIEHSFFIPDADFCVNMEGLVEYLLIKATKDFVCLWCNEKGKTFYNLDSVRKHMADKGHCKMLYEGEYLSEFVDFYDYSSSYPDVDENIDVDEELEDSNENAVSGDDYQLVLPSGLVVGHRSLLKYYKQRLNPNRQLVVKKSTKHLHKVLHEYRALGWTATLQEAASRKARDIHAMKRQQNKLAMQVGVKHNKLQHHFREQINF